MRLKKSLFAIAAVLLLTSCVSLSTVSLTSIPAKRDHKVRAEVSRVIVLGLNFDNDYVDQLSNDLKQKCPGGVISGILTKDEVVDYFLYLVIKHQISAEGYCSEGRATAKNSRDHRKPAADETSPAENSSDNGNDAEAIEGGAVQAVPAGAEKL